MSDLAAFPDVEVVMVAVLGDIARVGTRLPADPDGTLSWLPFLRVSCYGGSDNLFSDLSRVDVDAFAATKAEAATLAERVRQRLLNGGKPHVNAGWVLDSARTDTKPHEVPYVDNPPPYRYTAAYSTTARRST